MRNALHGYGYQIYVGTLRSIDILDNMIDSIVLEKKEHSRDVFDDMIMNVSELNEKHHYQIKYTNIDAKLKLSDFTTGKLSLNKLYDSYSARIKKYKKSNNYFHIYTNKKISNDDDLKNYLTIVNKSNTKFSDNKNSVFKLNCTIFNEKNLPEDIEKLKYKSNIKIFFDKVIIETEQSKYEFNDEYDTNKTMRSENDIDKKMKEIGIDQEPYKKRIKDTKGQLFSFVYQCAQSSTVITKKTLENQLGISRSFDSVKNTIYFNDKEFIDVDRMTYLNSMIHKHRGELIIIQGKPGSGKTWLLKKWLDNCKSNLGIDPIYYYAHIGITNCADSEKRITKQQIVNNLINSISDGYNIEHDYSATTKKLQEIMDKLNKISLEKSTTIPIIIDGLDHIQRIKNTAMSLSNKTETILDLIQNITIPSNICLIIGTQPGKHLKPIMEKHSKNIIIDVNGFTKDNIKEYFTRVLPQIILTDEQMVKIYDDTCGLPLLIYYISKEIKIKNISVIDNIPQTYGDVKKYYEYLFTKLDNMILKNVCKYLAMLEFPVEMAFLDLVYPKHLRGNTIMDNLVNSIIFLLRFDDLNKKYSIFHDSFREYIINIINNEDDKIKFANDIHKTLMENYSQDNTIGFKYILRYALLSEKYEEIINTVNPKFIDTALLKFHSQKDIINNINYAIMASSKTNDTVDIIDKGLLKYYSEQRINTLNNYHYVIRYFEIHPTELNILNIIDEGNFIHSFEDTLTLISLGLKNHVKMDYDRIMKILSEKYHDAPVNDNNLETILIIQCINKGYKSVLSSIKNLKPLQVYRVLDSILPFCHNEIIQDYNDENNKSFYMWDIMLLYTCIQYKHDEFQCYIQMMLPQIIINNNLYNFPHLLKKSNLNPELFNDQVTDVDDVKDFYDIDTVLKYEKQISICLFTKNYEILNKCYSKLDELLDPFHQKILKLIYYNAKLTLENDMLLEKSEMYTITSILLSVLKNDRYRDPDTCVDFKIYIRNVIDNLLKIIIKQFDIDVQEYLIKNSNRVGSSVYATSISYYDFFHMIINHNPNNEICEMIKEKFHMKLDMIETDDLVRDCLERWSILSNMNDVHAIKYYKDAINFSYSYGWRKDYLLFEVIHMIECLNIIKPKNAVTNLGKIVEFVEYLKNMTDSHMDYKIAKETSQKIISHNAMSGFKLSLQYGVDDHIYKDNIIEFCRVNNDCDPVLKYFLLKTILYYDNYDNKQNMDLFNIKLNCLKQLPSNISSTRKILNDFNMEILRDYPTLNNIIQQSFNEIAIQNSMPTLSLTSKFNYTNIDLNVKEKNYNHESTNFNNISELERIESIFKNNIYDWSMGEESNQKLLCSAYKKDKDRVNKIINDGISKNIIDKGYKIFGIIEHYSSFLSHTSQHDKLIYMNKKIILFFEKLFEKRSININVDSTWLQEIKYDFDINKVGFLFLLHQLSSADAEVCKIAFESCLSCLEYRVSNFSTYCGNVILDDKTSYIIKEKLIAIIDIHANSHDIDFEQIGKIIEYLENSPYKNFTIVGKKLRRRYEESN